MLISKLIIKLLHIYQIYISPLIASRCRFHITCSQYGIEVINKFGIIKGGWMCLVRILKCHPYTSIKK